MSNFHQLWANIIITLYLIAFYCFSVKVEGGFQVQERKIQRLVRSLGIGATYRGYRYLNYGLMLCMEDENYLLSVSKLLYPQIAKKYQATSSSVERDLRTVVNVCWERGNRQLLQSIAFRPLSSRPTSSEFLDILSDHIGQTMETPYTIN